MSALCPPAVRPAGPTAWLPAAALPALCAPSAARIGCALTSKRYGSLLRGGTLSALPADGVCCLPLPLEGPLEARSSLPCCAGMLSWHAELAG